MWSRKRNWVPAGAGMTAFARVAAIAAALSVASCGFQLRGDPALGVKALHVTANGGSTVATEVRRTLGTTKVAPTAAGAELILRFLGEARDKTVNTITGTGRVYEFQLRLIVRYEMQVPGREEPLIPSTEVQARRLITYSETAPIAKEAEEELLFKDMQAELAGRILRQVAIAQRSR